MSVDCSLLPAVMDQMFADNRDLHTPLALDAAVNFNRLDRCIYNLLRRCCHPLKKGGGDGVARILTAESRTAGLCLFVRMSLCTSIMHLFCAKSDNILQNLLTIPDSVVWFVLCQLKLGVR